MERATVPFPLSGLPWCTEGVPAAVRAHPTIGTTWVLCRRLFPLPKLSPDPSPMRPIFDNPAFGPGKDDNIFRNLAGERPIRTFNFIKEGKWLDKKELTESPLTQGLVFWRTLQTHPFLH